MKGSQGLLGAQGPYFEYGCFIVLNHKRRSCMLRQHNLCIPDQHRFKNQENKTFPLTSPIIDQDSFIALLFIPSSTCQGVDNPWPFLPLFLLWLSTHASASPLLYQEFPCLNSYWMKCLVRPARRHSR